MVDDLANLDRRIVTALTTLRGARAATQHSRKCLSAGSTTFSTSELAFRSAKEPQR